MTVHEALRLAEERLAEAGVDTPRVDAEWLVSHVLGVPRSEVFAEPDREVPGGFELLLERRQKREPLAYVLGEWGFRRLTLKTDARALVAGDRRRAPRCASDRGRLVARRARPRP